MGVRSGRQFLHGLSDQPREVWISGERVEDVTAHPAFAPAARTLATLYDMQLDPRHQDVLTYVLPNGERAGTAFMPAGSRADLEKHRRAYQLWAERTFGLMGRSPDFLNCTLRAFAEARDVFDRAGREFGDRITRYYEHVRDNDLFLSHALITPQNDRSKSSGEQARLHLRVVKERADGIVVGGARMLATLGAVSDEIIIYCLPGLKPGDEDHALVFAVPTGAPGLRQICREPYDTGGRDSFDHPLGTRFEETDSLLVFKDVFVPWERVFCYREVGLLNALYGDSALRNHTAHQTNTRALVKMQFATGIAVSLARAIKADAFLHVQRMLGEALGYVEIVKSALIRAEVECETTRLGKVRAALAPLQALRAFLPTAYPRVIEIIQTIAAGGFMMMPTGADLAAPELAEDTALYYQGAGGMPSVERVRLFKLAWDLAGDSFGARQLQYERYYAGDPVRILAGNYLGCDDREIMRLVGDALELSGDPVQRAGADGG
jgi:anthranilate 3-monooxygenase (FAD) / 4-hydroxyphenylacetate 3-monooxygenase